MANRFGNTNPVRIGLTQERLPERVRFQVRLKPELTTKGLVSWQQPGSGPTS